MTKAKSVKKSNKKTAKVLKSSSKASVVSNIDHLSDKLNNFRKKRYFFIFISILLLIALGYMSRSLLFAAIVDGKPISRIKLINELEKQGGEQTLDALINKELLTNEAKEKGINISDADISEEVERISELVESQGSNIDDALAMQGMTRENLNENIHLQLTVERLLADKIAISDEDVKKYFEDNKSYYGENAKFEDVQDSIKDQLIQEKLSSEYQILLEKLKSEGNIIYFVDFK